MNKVIPMLQAGDTLYVRGGTYSQAVNDTSKALSGNSWSNPITIAGYHGETVTVPSLGISNPQSHYVIFNNFIVDGSGLGNASAAGVLYADHIRFKNLEVKNTYWSNFEIRMGAAFNEVLNSKIHSSRNSYGLYIEGHDNLIEGNDIYDNAGFAIQIYNGYNHCCTDNNIIRHNRMWGNDYIKQWGGVITINHGANVQVYNNLLYNNFGGIDVARGSTHTQIYHNTLYNNDHWGVTLGGAQGGASINAVVRNNIIYGSPTPIIYGNEYSWAQNPVADHNLCDTAGPGCDRFGPPLFVNAGVGDFRLQATSPALDAGMTLPEVPTDFDGISRPQGSGYDIGAYEFTVGGTLRGDLDGSGKLDLTDVRLLIYMLIGQQLKTPEADLTGDGAVTLADVQALIRLLVGIS